MIGKLLIAYTIIGLLGSIPLFWKAGKEYEKMMAKV